MAPSTLRFAFAALLCSFLGALHLVLSPAPAPERYVRIARAELRASCDDPSSARALVLEGPLMENLIVKETPSIPVGGCLRASLAEPTRVSSATLQLTGGAVYELWMDDGSSSAASAPRKRWSVQAKHPADRVRNYRSPRLDLSAVTVIELRLFSGTGPARPGGVEGALLSVPTLFPPKSYGLASLCLSIGALIWVLTTRRSAGDTARLRVSAAVALIVLLAVLAMDGFVWTAIALVAALLLCSMVRTMVCPMVHSAVHPLATPRSLFCFFAAISLVYAFQLTQLTGDMFGMDSISLAYDAQAKAFLAGRVDISRDIAQWEGFTRGSETYIYFGPFPALLRLVLNSLMPDLYGRWERLSCLLAALLANGAFVSLIARRLGPCPASAARTTAFWLLATGFALGSPVLFLTGHAYVYHEAMLWGLSAALWSLVVFLDRSLSPEKKVLLLSLCAFVAALSRLTFGISALLFTVLAIRDASAAGRPLARSAVAALPAAAALALWLILNTLRFGSPLLFQNYDLFATAEYRGAALAPSGGAYAMRRIPTALARYLGMSTESFKNTFPFLQARIFDHQRLDLFPKGVPDGTISLMLSAPWLLLVALWGLRRLRRADGAAIIACTLPLIPVTEFFWVTARYQSDFLPLACIVLAAGLPAVLESRRKLAVVAGTVAFSVYATAVLTYDYQLRFSRTFHPDYREPLTRILSISPTKR